MSGVLKLRRLTVETLEDFLDYFDHRAFLNDQNWEGCYCQFYLNTGTEENSDNRELACQRVETGKMDGYLAYLDDKVVAWCAAANSLLFPTLPDADDQLARILCFNVDPDFRGQAIAGKMLDLVIEDLKHRGFDAIEAGPNSEGYGDKSYRGSLSMFLKRGFEVVTELGDGFVLVRRDL